MRFTAFALLALPATAQDSTSFKPTLSAGGYLKYLHGVSWVNAMAQATMELAALPEGLYFVRSGQPGHQRVQRVVKLDR